MEVSTTANISELWSWNSVYDPLKKLQTDQINYYYSNKHILLCLKEKVDILFLLRQLIPFYFYILLKLKFIF